MCTDIHSQIRPILSREYYEEKIKWSKKQINSSNEVEKIADIARCIDGSCTPCSCFGQLTTKHRPKRLMKRSSASDTDWKPSIVFIQRILQMDPAVILQSAHNVKEQNFLIGNLSGINARYVRSLLKNELRNPYVLLAIRSTLQVESTTSDREVQNLAEILLLDLFVPDSKSKKTGFDVIRAINRGIAFSILSQPKTPFNLLELCRTFQGDLKDHTSADVCLKALYSHLLEQDAPSSETIIEMMKRLDPSIESKMVGLINIPDIFNFFATAHPRKVRTHIDPAFMKEKLNFSVCKPVYDPVFQEIQLLDSASFTDYCKRNTCSEPNMLEYVLTAFTHLTQDPLALRSEAPTFLEASCLLQNVLSLLERVPSHPDNLSLLNTLSHYVTELAEEMLNENMSITTGRQLLKSLTIIKELTHRLLKYTQADREPSSLVQKGNLLCDALINRKIESLFVRTSEGIYRLSKARLERITNTEDYRTIKAEFFSQTQQTFDAIMTQDDSDFQSMIKLYFEGDPEAKTKIEQSRQNAFSKAMQAFEEWEESAAETRVHTEIEAIEASIERDEGKLTSLAQKFGWLNEYKFLQTNTKNLREVLEILAARNADTHTIMPENTFPIYSATQRLYDTLTEGLETAEETSRSLLRSRERAQLLIEFMNILKRDPRTLDDAVQAFDILPKDIRGNLCHRFWELKDTTKTWVWGQAEEEIKKDPFHLLDIEGMNLVGQLIEEALEPSYRKLIENLAYKREEILHCLKELIDHMGIATDASYATELSNLGLNPSTHNPRAIAFQIATSRISMPLKVVIEWMGKELKASGGDKTIYSELVETYKQVQKLIFKANIGT